MFDSQLLIIILNITIYNKLFEFNYSYKIFFVIDCLKRYLTVIFNYVKIFLLTYILGKL